MHRQTTLIQVTHCFEYPCQTVFDCWLQESATARWLLTAQDAPAAKVELDARVGGRFQISQQRQQGPLLLTGLFHLIEPPHQLLFSLENPLYAEPDLVRLQFTPHPFGCELTVFHHVPVLALAGQQKLIERWTNILMRLVADLNDQRQTPKRHGLTRLYPALRL